MKKSLGNGFWRQQRGDAQPSSCCQGSVSVSVRVWCLWGPGRERHAWSLARRARVCGNARWTQDLGPCLLSHLENGRMPFAAQTFLQLGLRCPPRGLPPCPREDSSWTDLSPPLSLGNSLTSFGALSFAPACGHSHASKATGLASVPLTIPALERHFHCLFPPVSHSPGGRPGLLR